MTDWETALREAVTQGQNDRLIDGQVALGALLAVEASIVGCPDRKLWTRGADRLWHCGCCSAVAGTEELVGAVLVGCGFDGPVAL